MNVLVYTGPGTTVESARNCTDCLRRVLSPYYGVINVDANVLINEPWMESTALLAIPGGADLPYCRELNGPGNEQIKNYVRRGGKYLGFCAGAYYASAKCEFEVGNPQMEVSGSRELAFFPGIARGPAYAGFKYGSHAGGRTPTLKINPETLPEAEDFKCYFNGGPCFVDADEFVRDGVQVLARYEEPLDVESGDGSPNAAAVYRAVGRGAACLVGSHPEFSFEHYVAPKEQDPDAVPADKVATLRAEDPKRLAFMRALLVKLGLRVTESIAPLPSLSRLMLTSAQPASLKYLLAKLGEDIGFSGANHNLLIGQNDTFAVYDAQDRFSGNVSQPAAEDESLKEEEAAADGDLNKVVKKIDVYHTGYPHHRETPYFNHEVYYRELEDAYRLAKGPKLLGNTMMYGEVVTSTSTMLDKNYSILKSLPHGLIAVGTTQVAGRGRASNVWVNPPGVLAVSGVLRLPIAEFSSSDHQTTSPIIFVQYLVALAMVDAIKGYGSAYGDMPIKLKWPNDVYAAAPGTDGTQQKDYVKVGGIIVNSNVYDGEYVLVFGCGINVSNPAPTTSVNHVLEDLNRKRTEQGLQRLPEIKIEVLLAKFLARFDEILWEFKYQGFAAFEQAYYNYWLHTDSRVVLEQYDNTRAIIRGITLDYGLLVVEEVDHEGRPLGKRFELQPDGNSFDMFKGLLKKKT